MHAAALPSSRSLARTRRYIKCDSDADPRRATRSDGLGRSASRPCLLSPHHSGPDWTKYKDVVERKKAPEWDEVRPTSSPPPGSALKFTRGLSNGAPIRGAPRRQLPEWREALDLASCRRTRRDLTEFRPQSISTVGSPPLAQSHRH